MSGGARGGGLRTFKTKPTSSCPDLPGLVPGIRASMFSACLRQDLTDAGAMAKRTMKAFDEMCLTPADDMPPEKTRGLRLRENASQAVFARHLNVTAGLVSQWERGEKRPRGASLKLLTLVAKNGLGAVA